VNQSNHRLDRRLIVISRRIDAMPSQLCTAIIDRQCLNFRSTEINPDAHPSLCH
jgi:hypothetical protein